jgi:quercetin dioxygenase-like cupin family protein
MVAMSGFHIGPIGHGLLFDRFAGAFPTRVYAWDEARGELALRAADSSFFGYVLSGAVTLHRPAGLCSLGPGQYFALQDGVTLSGGKGLIVERGDYSALNMVGGPVERSGRLRYIDGCTDTLLVPPVKRGDACLNALYFPTGIDQTAHTHPSIRVGIVASGRGKCRTLSGVVPLLPGQAFVIEPDSIHAFQTDATSGMVIIAYHPDSDFGPEDDDHPMINRTIVDGVSANRIEEIRTR